MRIGVDVGGTFTDITALDDDGAFHIGKIPSTPSDQSVALAEGVLGMALLVLLQYVVAWVAARHPRFERLVKREPTLLYRDGPLREAMRNERITLAELDQAARSQGVDLSRVSAIVLEPDGSLSVLTDAS